MSLDWSITKVKQWEQVSLREANGAEAAKTEALIWATMSLGIPTITKSNVDEWMFRLSTKEKLKGALINHYVEDKSMPGGLRAEPYYLTREDVERRIGLSTNASKLTRAAFLKRVTA